MECRRWYYPTASAVGHQCVCGPECRKARRRKQAKLRRAEDLEYFRGEERRRQQECRARRRGEPSTLEARAGPEPERQAVTPRHAPASSRNHWELRDKVRHLWDEHVRLSRASLDRELGRMGRKLGEIVSEALAEVGA